MLSLLHPRSKVQERRALRGLAASHKIMGNYKKAITYLEKVLEVSAGSHEGTYMQAAWGRAGAGPITVVLQRVYPSCTLLPPPALGSGPVPRAFPLAVRLT